MSRKRQCSLGDDELLEYLHDDDIDEPPELEENCETEYAPSHAGIISIQNFYVLCLCVL